MAVIYGLCMDDILDVATIKPEFSYLANLYAGNPPGGDCTAGELLSYIFDMVPEYSGDNEQPVYFDSTRFDEYFIGTDINGRDNKAIVGFIKKLFSITKDKLALLQSQICDIEYTP